ncbi:MAG: YifB family Mg chelatase-like AAA ATPase [Proteobacteria bacterium]|nr:YifB family Mg chelatase-like AAA ATPase [Pseudomonadota bacterium]
MVAIVKTFAFLGIEVVDVDVQVKIAAGINKFNIVGLADKAVAESKERVRAAITSMGLSLPSKRITINLAPADLAKEGSHFDLAIALGLLIEMGVIEQRTVSHYYCLGELSLDGSIAAVNGILPASIGANAHDCGIICPKACGSEAAWAGEMPIIAAASLVSLINHLKGHQIIAPPRSSGRKIANDYPDLKEIKGQQTAKRALEIAAAGNHNMLMIGPPGTGKSMLASRLPSIMPDLTLPEILETNMIHSISGRITDGNLVMCRPFRDPHHSCSMPAMVGGGTKAKPGEISLAHNGILFLDELAEFPRTVLDSLRQPIENGNVTISRVNSHINYPANFQLIAAMNPCRCGYLDDQSRSCNKAPHCGRDYQSKISGPLIDRMDIIIQVPQIDIFNADIEEGESSQIVAKRVHKAREMQMQRYEGNSKIKTNSKAKGEVAEKHLELDNKSREILKISVEKMNISMRGMNRILRVARTIADLDESETIQQPHLLEAIKYRKISWN